MMQPSDSESLKKMGKYAPLYQKRRNMHLYAEKGRNMQNKYARKKESIYAQVCKIKTSPIVGKFVDRCSFEIKFEKYNREKNIQMHTNPGPNNQ